MLFRSFALLIFIMHMFPKKAVISFQLLSGAQLSIGILLLAADDSLLAEHILDLFNVELLADAAEYITPLRRRPTARLYDFQVSVLPC